MKFIKTYIHVYNFLLLLFLLIDAPLVNSDINFNFLLKTSILVFISVILHFSHVRDKNYFRIDFFFLVSLIFVHLQWIVTYLFEGILPDYYNRLDSYRQYVNYGTWISGVGIQSWIIGFRIKNKIKTGINIFHIKQNPLLIPFSVFLFILFLSSVGNEFLTGTYRDKANWNILASYAYILFNSTAFLLIIQFFFKKNNKEKNTLKNFIKRNNKFVIIFIAAYCALFLYLGDRGGPLECFLIISIFYGTYIKPIGLGKSLTAFILAGTLFTFIGLTRNEQNFNFSESQVTDIGLQLGNSVRTLYKSIEYVDKNDIFYGKLFIGNLVGVVPFGQKIYTEVFDVSINELNTSNFTTFLTYGDISFSGEGTTIIADVYFNFGVSGVVLMLMFLGYFMKLVYLKMFNPNNFYWILIAAVFAANSVFYARASYFTPLKSLFYVSLIYLIFFKVSKIKK